ncbi:MAG: carboxypeptidase-like regulatory domain-containing protein [Pirellulaceae bacterium]
MTTLLCCILAVFQVEDARPATHAWPAGTVVTPDGAPVAGATVVLQNGFLPDAPVATTTTDSAGHFEFPEWRNEHGYWQLAAWKSGWAAAGFLPSVPASTVIPEIELELRLPAPLEIDVRLPDGSPASNPRYRISNLRTANLRRQSVDLLFSNSDFLPVDSFMDGLAPGDQVTLEILCDELPMQMASVQHRDTVTIQLKPTGVLQGVIDDPAGLIDGEQLQLTFRTSVRTDPRGSDVAHAWGLVTVETSESGEFEIQAPVGSVMLQQQQFPDRPWYIETGFGIGTENQPVIKANEVAEISLEIKPAVRVSGMLTSDDDQPVAGARLGLGGPLVTDENGEFHAWCPPGTCIVSWMSVPDPWLKPPGHQFLSIAAGAETYRIPTIKLERAAHINGQVVDEHGEPVPNAVVTASWNVLMPSGTIETGYDSASSDEQGRYVLKQTSGENRVNVSATAPDRASVEEHFIGPEDERLLDLTVTRDGRMAATGRVVDPQGNPVSGARVAIWEWSRRSRRPMKFGDKRFVLTDEEGRFGTPLSLLRRKNHHCVISAPGFTKLETEETFSPNKGDWEIGDIVVQPTSTISGTVNDATGTPVAGATVWTWSNEKGGLAEDLRTTCQTDTTGGFELEDIIPGSRFFYVEHSDHLLCGGPLWDDALSDVIRLTRFDATGADAAGFRLLDRSEMLRVQHLRDLLATMMPQSDRNDQRWLGTLIEHISATDMSGTEIETESLLETIISPEKRSKVLLNIGRVDQALTGIAQMNGTEAMRMIVRGAKHARWEDDDVQQISRTVADIVERESDVNAKVDVSCRWAVVLRSLGFSDEAETLARKSLELISEIDQPEAKRALALAIAPFDPVTSNQLLQPFVQDEYGRRFREVINEVAWGGPENVRPFLKHCPDQENVCGHLTQAAARMALVDLPGTLELIDESADRYRGLNQARSYANVARAIADEQPAQAKILLTRARQIISHRNQKYHNGLAVRLLWFAQSIDQESTSAYWWRAMAAQGGPYTDNPNISRELERVDHQAHQALLLIMFNQYPELRSRMMEGVFEYWESKLTLPEDLYYYSRASVAAMMLHDPDRAIVLAQRWWESNDLLYRIHPQAPAYLFVDVVALDREELMRVIVSEAFNERD